MAKEATGNFEIPREMRTFAEQSVEQARKAFDGFMTAAQKAASSIEGQASAAQSPDTHAGPRGPVVLSAPPLRRSPRARATA